MGLQFKIRSAQSDDELFLREMLLETLRSEDDGETYTLESLEEPRIALYVKGWGSKEGDLGFIAETADGQKLGAIWSRLFTAEEPGYGFVDEETPEIAIAMLAKSRGLGVGTALLDKLVSECRTNYRSISLSVAPNNPAKRLYERFGFKVVGYDDDHPVMLLKL